MIKKKIRDASVACIGPAGESLVAFANILIDKQGTWCRSGDGAIMGSKNLKAIAIHGTKRVKLADPKRFREMTMEYLAKLRSNPLVPTWKELGLLSLAPSLSEKHDGVLIETGQLMPQTRHTAARLMDEASRL